jgi:hypothetical protein
VAEGGAHAREDGGLDGRAVEMEDAGQTAHQEWVGPIPSGALPGGSWRRPRSRGSSRRSGAGGRR